ncbi:MAG: SpoIIE family protein phosphatase [Bacteroidales bacterium]|jgi:hypothetical protein|nr:SpoIIE family protein phosphatase [Bacteroidales bacterium]
MNNSFYIEIDCAQKNHDGERICGDVFLSKKIEGEDRIITVLSDGMGHGVKANILATLTATMALNFAKEHKDPATTADTIMNTLPVCSVRKISYSTFTIIDIENNKDITILEYDNPRTTVFRDNKIFDPPWQCIILNSEKNAGKEIYTCSFELQQGDRIVFWSDGIAQSGLGTNKYPFGWGLENAQEYVAGLLNKDSRLSASDLAKKVVNRAVANDIYKSKDDTSCASIYYREPRKLLVCTGPPYEKEKDKELISAYKNFNGKRVISGATTAEIIANGVGEDIVDSFEFTDNELPPISHMDSAEMITEGILTLSKAGRILESMNNNTVLGKGPADQIVSLFRESDEIHFIIGTRINIAHQDPTLPVELEIRRTVVKRMGKILEEKFLKEVHISFI